MGEVKRRFFVSGAVRQPARQVVTAHARPVGVTAQQREQVLAILDAPRFSNNEKQALVEAVLAGAVFDLAQFAAHAPMPGLPIVAAAPRAHAAAPTRPLSPTHSPMPGLPIGRPALRANASPPRREGPNGHFHMPGLPIGRAAR